MTTRTNDPGDERSQRFEGDEGPAEGKAPRRGEFAASDGAGAPAFSVYEPPSPGGGRAGSGERARSHVVLIADDDADFRELCARRLAMLGCKVLVAGGGEDAVRLATLTRPYLVLMDLVMPRTDGIEATRRLRADPRTQAIRIVGMTSFGRHWQNAAQSAGCDVVLSKAALIDNFERTVRVLLPDLAPDAPDTSKSA